MWADVFVFSPQGDYPSARASKSTRNTLGRGFERLTAWLRQTGDEAQRFLWTQRALLHCPRYSLFYRTVWITEAELLAMFESP